MRGFIIRMHIGERKKKKFKLTKNEISHPQNLKKLSKYDFCIGL